MDLNFAAFAGRSTAGMALQSYSKLKQGGWSFDPAYQPVIGLGCLKGRGHNFKDLDFSNVQGEAQLGAIGGHECFGPEGGSGECVGTATAAPLWTLLMQRTIRFLSAESTSGDREPEAHYK